MIVLGIDPGREKCGLAVVAKGKALVKQVVARKDYLGVALRFVKQYNVDIVVLGDGTGSREFFQEIQKALPEHEVVTINERLSTEEARTKYWMDHVPRGWRRLLPRTMQVPPEPYDDYVAVIIAQRYLSQQ